MYDTDTKINELKTSIIHYYMYLYWFLNLQKIQENEIGHKSLF